MLEPLVRGADPIHVSTARLHGIGDLALLPAAATNPEFAEPDNRGRGRLLGNPDIATLCPHRPPSRDREATQTCHRMTLQLEPPAPRGVRSRGPTGRWKWCRSGRQRDRVAA